MITIGELIDKLHEMADEIGDDAEVVLGCSDNASLYTLSAEDINNILLIDHSAHCYHEGVELCGRKHDDIEAATTVATATPSAKDFIKWLTSPEHAWQFNDTGDGESVVADGFIVFNEDIERWIEEQKNKQQDIVIAATAVCDSMAATWHIYHETGNKNKGQGVSIIGELLITTALTNDIINQRHKYLRRGNKNRGDAASASSLVGMQACVAATTSAKKYQRQVIIARTNTGGGNIIVYGSNNKSKVGGGSKDDNNRRNNENGGG